MSNPFVIGIDLSLTGTGLADLNLETGLFENVETFGTKGKRTDTYAMRGDRLAGMADYITSWATSGSVEPSLVVVEGPSIGSRGGSQFDRSGLWWLTVSTLQGEGIPVMVVPPKTRAKYATGNGNSGKDAVVAHVMQQYGDYYDGHFRNDNECDAVVLAAMGARHLGFIQEEDLPESNISAMKGVAIL